MKLFKKTLSVLLTVAMLLPMCIVTSYASVPLTIDSTVAGNWTPLAAKYVKGTYGILAPKSDNYAIRTTGFDFAKDEDNGIRITTASYNDNKGIFPVSAVASRHNTLLNDFSVTVKPDDLDMIPDNNGMSSAVSFLFSEERVSAVAGLNENGNGYDKGLYSAHFIMKNGLRSLAPVGSRSLTVTVYNENPEVSGNNATSVAIIYNDGSYVNCDNKPGWRWVFTAKNSSEPSSATDSSGIVQPYEEIDFTDGLTVSVRADTTLGYIVSINGKDYYEGERVAFFPDCSQATFDGETEGETYFLTEDDYIDRSENYLNSMTYAKRDIDLTGLCDVDEFYVTVGACGSFSTTANLNFTVTDINSRPAATWQGEETCTHETLDYDAVIKEPTCVEGMAGDRCTECGYVFNKRVLPAVKDHSPSQTWTIETAATCTENGIKNLFCDLCGKLLEQQSIEKTGHTFTNYVSDKNATSTQNGTKTAKCDNGCGTTDTVIDEGSMLDPSCGADLRWELDMSTGTLTISGSGDMYDFSSENAPWYDLRYSIKSVLIGDGVTSIGKRAFRDCRPLTNITIPDSVTKIGSEAFEDCTMLSSIDIPDSVTEIGSAAFYYCTMLSSIDIPDSVTHIGDSAFYNCYSLKNVTIGGGVTGIGSRVFSNCTGLTDINIPNTVTVIGNYAFEKCRSLANITIPDSVTDIGDYAFTGCSSLENITIPASVTSISPTAFRYCGSRMMITVDSNNQCYTSRDGILYNKDMTTLLLYRSISGDSVFTIPDTVTEIGSYSFENTDLQSIVIPDTVTKIGSYSFANTGLQSIVIPDTVTEIGSYSFANTGLQSIVIPETVTNMGEYAFSGCQYLEDVTIYSDMEISDGAFHDCGSLTSITMDSVTGIGEGAFSYCTSLTNITIPDSVTDIGGYAFFDCNALKSIQIGNSVKSIGDYAFDSCFSLNNITIPDSVISIGDYAFYDCSSLKGIHIGSSVKSIGNSAFVGCNSLIIVSGGYSVTTIGTSAFSDCSALTDITLYDSLTTIGSLAFSNCNALESVRIGFGVKSIGKDAFLGCTALTRVYISDIGTWCGIEFADLEANPLYYAGNIYSGWNPLTDVVIPDGVTSINRYAFYNCTSLENIHIPASVVSIDYDVFTGCTSLTGVYIKDIAAWCNIDFADFYANPLYYAHDLYRNGRLVTDLVIPDTVTKIKTRAFTHCTSITGVSIPDTVERIYDFAFNRCTSLEKAIIPVSVTQIDSLAFRYCPDLTFHGSVRSYAEMYAIANDIPFVCNNVTSNGVMITLHDLYDVKDFFIAKGHFETYRAMKDNGYIVNVTNAKLWDRTDYRTEYTYTVYEPGVHTVIIRYYDGDVRFFYPELTVDEPVFETNGLQVTVSNIPGIKAIRTAYGEWTTTKQVKAADTYRCFSNKTSIKDADPFVIQYRDEGIVTVMVEYANGYIKVFHYNVQKLKPTVEHNGNTITFGNLDSLNVLRYAKGQYTSSADIKRAEGSKALKLRDAVDARISVTLEPGTYTFCVQYDDNSYNYFVITV